MQGNIVIITGASPLDPAVVDTVPASAIVLGVDGGLDSARAAGLRPSGLVGDLDSVSPEGLAWAEEHATIARHPTDKAQTDTELALLFAADMQPERLTMIGGGERLDHTWPPSARSAPGVSRPYRCSTGGGAANTSTSSTVRDAGHCSSHPVRSSRSSRSGHDVTASASTGVRWPLDDHTLEPVVGLGVSNEVTDPDGAVPVTVSNGVLTIFDVPTPERS